MHIETRKNIHLLILHTPNYRLFLNENRCKDNTKNLINQIKNKKIMAHIKKSEIEWIYNKATMRLEKGFDNTYIIKMFLDDIQYLLSR